MRTRLTERDLSRIVRRVLNEQPEDTKVLLKPVEPVLHDMLEKVKDIQRCDCGDYEKWRRGTELLEKKLEELHAISTLPDKMPTLPPKEI